jgi:hypothetical protein
MNFKLKVLPEKLISISSLFSNSHHKNYPDLNGIGVYIWGFKFDKDRFFPYYVGQAGGVKGSTKSSLLSRLDCHFHFKMPYNVIKQSHIEEFIKKGMILTDAEFNKLENEKIRAYREHFSYFNKKNYSEPYGKSKTRRIYKALNDMKSQRMNVGDINNMQNLMYACWIPATNQIKKNSDSPKIILELEKYVHHSIKARFKLSGLRKGHPTKKYKFEITDMNQKDFSEIINNW